MNPRGGRTETRDALVNTHEGFDDAPEAPAAGIVPD
jgi:hypothetical protein